MEELDNIIKMYDMTSKNRAGYSLALLKEAGLSYFEFHPWQYTDLFKSFPDGCYCIKHCSDIGNNGPLVWKNITDIQATEFYCPGDLFTPPTFVWVENGRLHRKGGPAYIRSEPGSDIDVVYEMYFTEGLLHNECGPAVKDYSTNNSTWYLFNKVHRWDGPAEKRVYLGIAGFTEHESPNPKPRISEFWWLAGVNVGESAHKKFKAEPLSKMPLYFGTRLEEAAKWRLEGLYEPDFVR